MRIFETERLIVRPYTKHDKENFFSLNGNEEVMRYIRAAKTREECDNFLDEVIAAYDTSPGMGRWAVDEKLTGKFVGSFAIIPIPDQMEKIQIGYSLAKEHWGKGFATELTMEGVKVSFDQLNLSIIYGVTEMPNVASQKVLLKAGFKDAGTLMEKEKTLLIFSLSREEYIGIDPLSP